MKERLFREPSGMLEQSEQRCLAGLLYRRLKVHREAGEPNEAAIEADARYDGKFVVLTNTTRDAAFTPLTRSC